MQSKSSNQAGQNESFSLFWKFIETLRLSLRCRNYLSDWKVHLQVDMAAFQSHLLYCLFQAVEISPNLVAGNRNLWESSLRDCSSKSLSQFCCLPTKFLFPNSSCKSYVSLLCVFPEPLYPRCSAPCLFSYPKYFGVHFTSLHKRAPSLFYDWVVLQCINEPLFISPGPHWWVLQTCYNEWYCSHVILYMVEDACRLYATSGLAWLKVHRRL